MKPCIYCDTLVSKDVWKEKLEMCINCSNDFFNHKINPYDPDTFLKNKKKVETNGN